MEKRLDTAGIAARIRELVGDHGSGDISKTAARLGVEELALRLSVDPLSPQPSLHVLIAVVREYGVDPSWLIHGEYDSRTHHAALENAPNPADILSLLVAPTSPVVDIPAQPDDPPRLEA